MFVLRWVMWCTSLPLAWLGQLAVMLGLPLSVPLLKTAWYLGGEGKVAVMAMAEIQRHVSLHAACAQAAEWVASRPQPEICVQAGLLAIQAQKPEEAEDYLARCQQLGPDPNGLLELLEILVAGSTDGEDAVAELLRRLEHRKDLSPVVSKVVHAQLLWEALLDGRFEEAHRRAEWLWSIEDDPLAATTFWVLARREGKLEDFAVHCARLGLTKSENLYFETVGHIAAGSTGEAQKTLSQLAEVDASAAEQARRLLQRREAGE